ncbi:hypothetical protein V6N13_136395 [Hibiscus sabdariffa]
MPSRPPLRCFRACKEEEKNGRRQHSYLHRYPLGHHLASSWSLPQVWLPGGVLDLSCTDPLRVHPGYHLCYLRHHQIDMWRFGVGGFLFV